MKKISSLLFCFLLICRAAHASPWAEKESYGGKTGGKFLFGLKNTLLGWTEIFTEPTDHKYDLQKTQWEGLCNGVASSVFYTANGLIQLATFPIPVDFPNMGEGTLPGLGKKQGSPKPWQVNGRSKYSIVPASEVAETAAPVSTPEPAVTPQVPTSGT